MSTLHQTDAYKLGHAFQYEKGTNLVFSNLTPRTSRVEGMDYVVWAGVQPFVMRYIIKEWNDNFFSKPVDEVVGKYKRRVENMIGKDAITYDHVRQLHAKGYLPLSIYSLPEGSKVPLRVPGMVLWNEGDEFYWVTNYVETALSQYIWGPITSATTAHRYRNILSEFAERTVGPKDCEARKAFDFLNVQAHDFSSRGMQGPEAARMSGASHLFSFWGTDTVDAIDYLEEYYGADSDKEIVGITVPATEHSVMCLSGETDEKKTFERLLTETYPSGIVSVVSDTWDFWKVITEYLPQMKDMIMARNGKLVIRPDSGNPEDIICGDLSAPVGSPEYKGAIECLWETFGGTITDKGFKLLDSHIGLIYGDSITPERCREICTRLYFKGFASFNVVLGVGSYTYQYVTRDTYGLAVKATYGEVNHDPRDIFKKPKTDSGMKNSARGLLAVYEDSGKGFSLKEQATWDEVMNCAFRPIYVQGKLVHTETLSNIRERLFI